LTLGSQTGDLDVQFRLFARGQLLLLAGCGNSRTKAMQQVSHFL
jgi:hypothetical protein